MRWVAVVLLIPLAACVGPAWSYGSYEGKAGATANDMLSAVASARLTVEVAVRGNAFGPDVTVGLTEAEKDAGAIQGTFDSIQPPDARSDQLRGQLDSLMSSAVSALAALRIAAHRNQISELGRLLKPLSGLADKLDAFGRAHA
jgi:hypothetical protein